MWDDGKNHGSTPYVGPNTWQPLPESHGSSNHFHGLCFETRTTGGCVFSPDTGKLPLNGVFHHF